MNAQNYCRAHTIAQTQPEASHAPAYLGMNYSGTRNLASVRTLHGHVKLEEPRRSGLQRVFLDWKSGPVTCAGLTKG